MAIHTGFSGEGITFDSSSISTVIYPKQPSEYIFQPGIDKNTPEKKKFWGVFRVIVVFVIIAAVVGGTGRVIYKLTSVPVNFAMMEIPRWPTAISINDLLDIHSTPDSSKDNVIIQARKGNTLSVTGAVEKGWLPVEYSGKAGFVSADLVKVNEPASLINGTYTFNPPLDTRGTGIERRLVKVVVYNGNMNLFLTSTQKRFFDKHSTLTQMELDNPSKTYNAITNPRWDKETGAYVITFQNVTSTRLRYIETDENSQRIIDEIILEYPDNFFKVGNTGPGGGKIFYISKEGFASNGRNCHYLEAAPEDVGTLSWISGSKYPEVKATQQDDLGTGEENTAAILAADANAPAALACDQYNHGGKDDWFLPSKFELSAMYWNKEAIGGFSDGIYWSSSLDYNDDPWYQKFSNGFQDHSHNYPYNRKAEYFRNTKYSVRPIRAF
jgi:hypothetical protein